jgi:radical SAM additional 4Fe4S-binding domain
LTDNITASFDVVKKWIGNPLSRAALRFFAKEDQCGNRLSLAVDYYLGEPVDACWKCRMAGRFMRRTLTTGEHFFGVKDAEVRSALGQPPFKKGLVTILQSIAEYGVTMPQKIYAPILVVWDCTHACNLKCKHCYQDAQKKLADELSTEEAKRMLDDLARSNVVALAFSGGEPLMRKDFFEVAKYAREKGMFLALATNGTMITKEVAKKLKEIGFEYVEISIDGKDAATHDGFRGSPGMFDRSVEGIKNCVAEGLYTCVATTPTQDNLTEIPAIYDLARDLKAARLVMFNFIPTGRGVTMAEGDLSPDEREALLKQMFEKNYDGSTEVLSSAPQYARVAMGSAGVSVGHFLTYKDVDDRALGLLEFIGGCGAGRHYCCIRPNGDIEPCVFMRLKVGNVRQNKLLDVWHTSPVLEQLRGDRNNLKGHCGICDHRYVCGGCRARALAYFGDLNAPDPGCINNRDAWEEVARRGSKVESLPQAHGADQATGGQV